MRRRSRGIPRRFRSRISRGDGGEPFAAERAAIARRLYGKIRVVGIGEDYKVRSVGIGEDLRVRVVDLGANSPGLWEFVDIGEDYKVRFVDIGEDITVRFVGIGEGPR